MAQLIRQVTGIASASLLVCLLLALGLTVRSTCQNDYLSYGFHQSIVLCLQHQVSLTWRLVLSGVLLLWLITRLSQQARGAGLSVLIKMLAIGAGVLLFLQAGTWINRARFADDWTRLRDWGSWELPRALWKSEVWLINLGIGIGAILVATAVWLLLRATLGKRPDAAQRWWRLLQRPAVSIVCVAIVIALSASAKSIHARARALPNIVLISIDTLRADRLGCYGCERATSPQLDRLAQQSFLFAWAISPAPNTPPAHMSLFTSLYPTVHGFTGNRDKLADWRLTVTEYLRERGYRTFATTDGGFLRGRVGFGQGFERFDDRRKGIAESVELSLQWLDRDIGSDSFFLFLHCYDVHSPYAAPPPHDGLFADPGYDGSFAPTADRLSKIKIGVNRNPEAGHGLSDADIAYMIARYDEGIHYTDAWLGRFVAELADRDLLAETWLIVTSDHGEEFTEHGSVLHEKLYHTVTHVPLLIRPPGRENPPRRIGQIVELTDVMPTILAASGIETADLVQGRSLLPLMEGRQRHWKDTAYSELPWFGRRRAITAGEYHLLTSLDGGEVEVYRYRQDPLEQRPLPVDMQSEAIREQLARLLLWSKEQLGLAAGAPEPVEIEPLDRATREQLRSLGYIQ